MRLGAEEVVVRDVRLRQRSSTSASASVQLADAHPDHAPAARRRTAGTPPRPAPATSPSPARAVRARRGARRRTRDRWRCPTTRPRPRTTSRSARPAPWCARAARALLEPLGEDRHPRRVRRDVRLGERADRVPGSVRRAPPRRRGASTPPRFTRQPQHRAEVGRARPRRNRSEAASERDRRASRVRSANAATAASSDVAGSVIRPSKNRWTPTQHEISASNSGSLFPSRRVSASAASRSSPWTR